MRRRVGSAWLPCWRPAFEVAPWAHQWCAVQYPEAMVTVEDVRSVAIGLPRTTEAVVRGRLKFRVGRIVYAAFSRDETVMGFGFPKEWREVVVASEPKKFMLPSQGDMRYNWVHVRLAAIDKVEMRDLIVDAWSMCVPKRVSDEYQASSR
jgi:hypothetical protein